MSNRLLVFSQQEPSCESGHMPRDNPHVQLWCTLSKMLLNRFNHGENHVRERRVSFQRGWLRCVRQESSAHWSIEVLLLKMSEVRRGVGGRPAALVEGGKSTQYYVCEACPAKVKAFHLKKHYKDSFCGLICIMDPSSSFVWSVGDKHTQGINAFISN